MWLACKQQAVILDMRVINLSVGNGLIVLFDAVLLFWLSLKWERSGCESWLCLCLSDITGNEISAYWQGTTPCQWCPVWGHLGLLRGGARSEDKKKGQCVLWRVAGRDFNVSQSTAPCEVKWPLNIFSQSVSYYEEWGPPWTQMFSLIAFLLLVCSLCKCLRWAGLSWKKVDITNFQKPICF